MKRILSLYDQCVVIHMKFCEEEELLGYTEKNLIISAGDINSLSNLLTLFFAHLSRRLPVSSI